MFPRSEYYVPPGRRAYHGNWTRALTSKPTPPPPDVHPLRNVMDGVGAFLEDLFPPLAAEDSSGIISETVETVTSYSRLKKSPGASPMIEVPGMFQMLSM